MPQTAGQDELDGKQLMDKISKSFINQVFTVDQSLAVEFCGTNYMLVITDMEALDVSALQGGRENSDHRVKRGLIISTTVINLSKAQGSAVVLKGLEGTKQTQNIIRKDWNFEQMGIGGLDDEFSEIFRRAFASRLFPPDIVKRLGVQHVKGMLLYGPPGTGKTLIARQIGDMLCGKEPKVNNSSLLH